MDKGWLKIISVTGAVGVVGLLFSTLMVHLFSPEIIGLLGSEKLFYILILLICVFALGLILAILKPKKGTEASVPERSTKNVTVNYKNSTHKGDNHF